MKFSQDSLIFLMTVSRNLILWIHLDNWFDERDKKTFAAPGFQHAACLTSHLLGSRLCLELVVTTLDHTRTNTHVAEGWKMCQVS